MVSIKQSHKPDTDQVLHQHAWAFGVELTFGQFHRKCEDQSQHLQGAKATGQMTHVRRAELSRSWNTS